MARKTASFKLVEKKVKKKGETKTVKFIVIYNNVEQSDAEKALIEVYLKNGYVPKMEEKKPGKTVAEMRKELSSAPEKLKEFNDAYSVKGGFHKACKIYSSWKKENK